MPRTSTRVFYALALVLQIAWCFWGGIFLIGLLGGGVFRTPESGFAGIELFLYQLPLWCICYLPAPVLTFMTMLDAQDYWQSGERRMLYSAMIRTATPAVFVVGHHFLSHWQ